MSSGQARAVKVSGDRLRRFFRKQCVDKKGYLKEGLLSGLNGDFMNPTYVLKSGKNWQFHLGSFEQFTKKWQVELLKGGKIVKYNCESPELLNDLRSQTFIKSYILKGKYFVIYDTENWLIFNSWEILDFMQDTDIVKWRILESGRIKGDVYYNDIKRSIFTFEYRAEEHKRQFVFGAHGGGAGERLKLILKDSLFFNSVPVDYGLWRE